MAEEKIPYTYWDLFKALLNKLSEEQLKEPVRVLQEEKTIPIMGLHITEYDYYYNEEDHEDCGSLEELKTLHGDDFDESQYKLGSPAGTVFLAEDF